MGGDGGTDDAAIGDSAADATSEDAAADAMAVPDPLRRVLFVGNSYTYYNDLPMVVAAIGEASLTPLEVEAVTVGGATLYEHWTTTGARERIEMGGLDVVVLQGQSLEAGGESFDGAAMLFADILTDVQTVWFATWARHESDPMFTGTYTPADMTERIDRGYDIAASYGDGDIVARVGAAWEIARVEMPEVRLHEADGSHPRPEGSLLAACVIHQAITGRTARLPDPPPLGIEPSLAEALCAIAPRVACPFETEDCDGECIDTRFDPLNCGGCGVVCDGEDPCRFGECGCYEGYTGCDRACVDLQTDADNCGACGVVCPGDGGEVCSGGSCLCEQATVRPITLAELSGCDAWEALGDGRRACNVALHDYCAALSCFDSGMKPFGGHAPLLIEDVMCVQGDVRSTTLAELAMHEAACTTDTLTQECVTAVHRYCVDAGAASGFGPVAETASGRGRDLHSHRHDRIDDERRALRLRLPLRPPPDHLRRRRVVVLRVAGPPRRVRARRGERGRCGGGLFRAVVAPTSRRPRRDVFSVRKRRGKAASRRRSASHSDRAS